MPVAPFALAYDTDRFIHVPLDFAGTDWADAEEWAGWLADTATRGRLNAEAYAAAIRENALLLARFPAEHVSFRFWHYPADGNPTGWVDVYVQARDDDGTPPEQLLPDTGFTTVPPVVDPVDAPHLRGAVRRLTLGVALPVESVDAEPAEDAEPVLQPRAEWIGSDDGWVCYVVSIDHDVAALESRLADIDALFAGIDPSELAGS